MRGNAPLKPIIHLGETHASVLCGDASANNSSNINNLLNSNAKVWYSAWVDSKKYVQCKKCKKLFEEIKTIFELKYSKL